MTRVVALGLDSVEWQLIEPMLDSGELPSLSKLRERGAVTRLRDDANYRTSLVWPAFLGGCRQSSRVRHGGVAFDPLTYRTWHVGAVQDQNFFADRPGVRTVTFDVPYLPLVGSGDNVRVCEWGPHTGSCRRESHPTELMSEIDALFGPHPAVPIQYESRWHQPGAIDRLAEALCDGVRRRAAICRWLLGRYPEHELFLAVMTEGHSAGEAFGHGPHDETPLASTSTADQARRRLRDVYRALDTAVGEIASALPDGTALVVFALYGLSAECHDVASTVLLPELLYRLRFGRSFLRDPDQRPWRGNGCPPIVPALAESSAEYIRGRMRESERIRGRVHRARRRWQRGRTELYTPQHAEGIVLRPFDYQTPAWYEHRWRRMRAFALPSFSGGRVRINLAGRERAGVVAVADYTAACDEVERQLLACRDARTGREVVGTIVRPRAHDPLEAGGPDADLVVEWRGWTDAIEHPTIGCIGPFPSLRTCGHSPRGFALIADRGLEPRDLGEHDVGGLAPTIARLLGHGVPPEFADSAALD